jgi:hypothetical protein
VDLMHRKTACQSGEQAARVDLRELARITDGDDLRTRVFGALEQGGENAGADHSGFVNDEDGSWVELEPAVVEVEEPLGDRRRRDAGCTVELAGGASRECCPDDPVARVGPHLGGAAEGRGLASPGCGDNDVDPAARRDKVGNKL